MSEYREAYLKTRDIIAEKLKEKYNFIPIESTSRCLSLTNKIATIHITFDIPEGDDIHITESKTPELNDSFMGLVVKKYPDLNDMKRELKKLFKPKEHFDSVFDYINSSLSNKIHFLEVKYPDIFISSNI